MTIIKEIRESRFQSNRSTDEREIYVDTIRNHTGNRTDPDDYDAGADEANIVRVTISAIRLGTSI
jgi:hypothetical protein